MSELPEPRLTHVYRLEAALGEPLDIGDVSQGYRRIVAADRRHIHGAGAQREAAARRERRLADRSCRTAPHIGDIRYTLRTDDGALLYVQSRSVRHGSPPRSSRGSARGDEVDASDYTFRASTQIETAVPRP